MHNEDPIAGIVTLDILKEELAVVENCITTTPDTPFTINRRNRLLQQKAKLLEMMAQITGPTHRSPDNREERNISSADEGTSTSSSLSPGPSTITRLAPPLTLLDRLKKEGSVSGFSTPRSVKEEEEYPFASVVEEPFPEADHDAERVAQELTYAPTHQFLAEPSLTLWGRDWEFAQQISRQLNEVDNFDNLDNFDNFDIDAQLAELERERQAQIEAYPPSLPFYHHPLLSSLCFRFDANCALIATKNLLVKYKL